MRYLWEEELWEMSVCYQEFLVLRKGWTQGERFSYYCARGKEGKKDPPSVPEGGTPKGMAHFQALRVRVSNRMIMMMLVGYNFFLY